MRIARSYNERFIMLALDAVQLYVLVDLFHNKLYSLLDCGVILLLTLSVVTQRATDVNHFYRQSFFLDRVSLFTGFVPPL